VKSIAVTPPPGTILPPRTWHRTTDPLYVARGTAAALIKGESTAAIDEWLISPKFFVSTKDSTLRFRWLGNPNFASDVVATCEVRSKKRYSWLVVWGVSQENGGLAFEYPERTISLGPWLGDSVEVAFHAVGTNGADFGVDEIETGAIPVTRRPPNDDCKVASPIPRGPFKLSGTTCYATNDHDPTAQSKTCVMEAGGGPDVFYSLEADAGDTLRIRVPMATGNEHAVYVLSSCDVSAHCVAGQDAHGGEAYKDAVLEHVFSTPGRYILVVDAMAGTCGDFSLDGSLKRRARR
jgi:hypothetical protein